MASRAEINENLPETLPADFGEWDGSESPAAPSETKVLEPPAVAPAEAKFNRASAPETSRVFEPGAEVAPLPELETSPVLSRGFPTPAVRAPKKPTDSPSTPAATSAKKESKFSRRVKSFDNVVDKHPNVESRIDEISGAPVALIDRKPDVPIFSKAAMEAEELNENSGPLLLNRMMEEEEERAAKRKWIISASVFGGSLILVAFQLFHYGGSGKLKNLVSATHAATISDTDTGTDTYMETKPSAAHAFELKESGVRDAQNQDAQSSDGSMAGEAAPAVNQREIMQAQLTAPTRLPANARSLSNTNDAPPPATLGGASMAALNGGSSFGNVFSDQSNTKVSGPRAVTVSSGVASGMLIRKTQPVYPSIARSARVQGSVVLQAKISRSGNVTDVQVVSGPPMLRQSAIDAVKTWQYRPYLLNNQPTEVNTTIDVRFSLGG